MKAIQSDEKKVVFDGLIDLFSQNRRWLLFVGTGISCALDKELGMPALERQLVKEMPNDADGWPEVRKRLEEVKNLEAALTGVGLHEETKRRIETITGDFVSKRDSRLREDILCSVKCWPGESLMRNLVQRLPANNPRLPVVTPNYDMLIEYACAKNGIRYTTGYVGELLRTWNWNQAMDSMSRNRVVNQRSKTVSYRQLLPRVELHKVHGSINLFWNQTNHQRVECDSWVTKPPRHYRREIAAPGDLKFESYAHNPDPADVAREAIDGAAAFLVIGYGFNDPHLHERILGRVQQTGCPLVVLTLHLSDKQIKTLRESGSRTWVLTSGKDAAGNTICDQTRIRCPLLEDRAMLENERLWSCDAFADKILGA